MKRWKCLMTLGLAAVSVVGCSEEGTAEKFGKKIDAFAEDTKEKARELKQDVERELKSRRDKEDELRREKEVLRRQKEEELSQEKEKLRREQEQKKQYNNTAQRSPSTRR